MRESQVLFRRRAAVFAAVSVLVYLALLLALRYSYQKVNRQVVSTYSASQQELAGRMAAQSIDELQDFGRQVQRLATAAETVCDGRTAPCEKLFARQMPVFAKDGALDILLLDGTGTIIARSGDQDFFSRRGMQGWPPEAVEARKKALVAAARGAVYSQVFTYRDEQNTERPALLVAAPVFARPQPPPLPVEAAPLDTPATGGAAPPATPEQTPAAQTPEEESARGELENAGAVVVPLSLEPMSARLQRIGSARARRKIMLIGPDKLILSHSTPDYVGASVAEIMALNTHPDLKKSIDAMIAGKGGTTDYYFPEGGDNHREILWGMAYAPVKTPAGAWGAAISWPHADIPLNGVFLWKYMGVALCALALLIALNLLPLMEFRRMLNTSDELLKMHDINAINEILRTINEELTEDKRVLEARVQEIESLHEQNLHILDHLSRSQLELFGTIRKPSREQRDIIRLLKRDTETLQKKPEGRFWKKASEE
jgi:hypothetical protein